MAKDEIKTAEEKAKASAKARADASKKVGAISGVNAGSDLLNSFLQEQIRLLKLEEKAAVAQEKLDAILLKNAKGEASDEELDVLKESHKELKKLTLEIKNQRKYENTDIVGADDTEDLTKEITRLAALQEKTQKKFLEATLAGDQESMDKISKQMEAIVAGQKSAESAVSDIETRKKGGARGLMSYAGGAAKEFIGSKIEEHAPVIADLWDRYTGMKKNQAVQRQTGQKVTGIGTGILNSIDKATAVGGADRGLISAIKGSKQGEDVSLDAVAKEDNKNIEKIAHDIGLLLDESKKSNKLTEAQVELVDDKREEDEAKGKLLLENKTEKHVEKKGLPAIATALTKKDEKECPSMLESVISGGGALMKVLPALMSAAIPLALGALAASGGFAIKKLWDLFTMTEDDKAPWVREQNKMLAEKKDASDKIRTDELAKQGIVGDEAKNMLRTTDYSKVAAQSAAVDVSGPSTAAFVPAMSTAEFTKHNEELKQQALADYAAKQNAPDVAKTPAIVPAAKTEEPKGSVITKDQDATREKLEATLYKGGLEVDDNEMNKKFSQSSKALAAASEAAKLKERADKSDTGSPNVTVLPAPVPPPVIINNQSKSSRNSDSSMTRLNNSTLAGAVY
jgi:hypothetical protein